MKERPRLFAVSVFLLGLVCFDINHYSVLIIAKKSLMMIFGGCMMFVVGLNCIVFPDHLTNLSERIVSLKIPVTLTPA